MTLLSAYEDAQDPTFRKKVSAALDKIAQFVASEATGQYPAAYTKRQTLAYRVKYQNADATQSFALSLTAAGGLTTASSDPDIENAVSAQWDAFAGVTNLDKV